MTQFYSRNDVNYSGDVYSIPFKYIHKKEVKVYIDDELWTKWHFLNTNQLTLDEVPEGIGYNNIVSVRRETDIKEKVVTYDNNSLLNKENLNKSQDQLIYAVQEIYDNNVQFQIDTDDVIETNKQELLEIQDDFKQEVYKIVDTVKDAADKVNELEEAVSTAVTAANTATEQAEIAINKTEETTELVEQFTENIDFKISTNNENMQNVLAETEAILQEAKDTLDDTLNKSQITNCILEVPQNIKLELNEGVLTLKAGSKVIVPNGVGVFDEVVITQDKSTNPTANGVWMCFINESGNLQRWDIKGCFSGTTAPTSATYPMWYDTTNNIIKSSDNKGSTWTGKFSLPIAIFTISNGVITSIDQVFNGMGYIGSTIWVDKGVKGLIPNGRNEDGSLRNIEHTTQKIIFANWNDGTQQKKLNLFLGDNDVLARVFTENYFIGISQPTASASLTNWFNTAENIIYSWDKTNSKWQARTIVYIGDYEINNGVITSIDSKQPFRAVDYNDFNTLNNNALLDSDKATITTWALPSTKRTDLTLGASGTQYTAPANGWFFLQKGAKSNNQYVYMSNNSTPMRAGLNMMANHTCYLSLPALKGEKVTISYDATGNTGSFYFVYAKGDQ